MFTGPMRATNPAHLIVFQFTFPMNEHLPLCTSNLINTISRYDATHIALMNSVCSTALGSTQPLIEMSTRNISWGVKAAGAYG